MYKTLAQTSNKSISNENKKTQGVQQEGKGMQTKEPLNKTKKDGTPDRRYKENQKLKKDGTPDKRFKENKAEKK